MKQIVPDFMGYECSLFVLENVLINSDTEFECLWIRPNRIE
jgi:hypothetical protein